MATIIESGLAVTLPAGLDFRFETANAYKAVKGKSVKEMDFAWIDNGKLFLLEVKDFTQVQALLSTDFVPVKGQPEPYRFKVLVDKVTDSLLMIMSAWACTTWGQQLKVDLPAQAHALIPLKIVIALQLPPALVVHLQAIRDTLNARLRGRLAIAGVGSVAVIDYTKLVSDPIFKGYIALHP